MTFAFTDEQEQLRSAARRFLADRSDRTAVRALLGAESAGDREVWRLMAEQLGLQGLVVPEQYGGSGCGPVELGLVLEEMGAALLVSPFFATVALGAQALVASDDAALKARWLPGVADGSRTATLALTGSQGLLDTVEVTARPEGDGWLLDGVSGFVLDGTTADLLLVVAAVDGQRALFALTGEAPGLVRTAMQTLDPTRRLARLELAGVRAERVVLGCEPDGWFGDLESCVLAALSAELLGVAQRALDLAVAHAKSRVQFGRPIGSFQAVKHTLADLLLQVEQARSAAWYALGVAAEGGTEAAVAASVAKAVCAEAATAAGKACIQVHGGVGFTWEHDAHLYLKRAKSSELLLGTPARHRARVADLVGI